MNKRSRRYQESKKKFDDKAYKSADAIKKVIENAVKTFDPSLEIHMRLGLDPKKSEQQVRGSVILPHGTGKKIRIAVFAEGESATKAKEAGAEVVGGEDLIKEIKKTGKCDFDIAVAEPSMMRYLGQIGKVLGTKGLMPNPKNETISPTPDKTVKALLSGKISYKADSYGNIHQPLGKISFGEEKLLENYKAFLADVKKNKPEGIKGAFIKNIYLNSTMSPSVRVK